jgi:hypothetical protein
MLKARINNKVVPSVFQKRSKQGKSPRLTFTVSDETIKNLDKVRSAFHRRYPLAAFPTLSAVLEKILAKDLAMFNRKPAELAKVVQEFEVKYPKSNKPATIQPDDPA